jgi:hemerythrin-like metal-binding protein
MRPRAWDEGIGTGVSPMDAEHRLQVSLVNALEDALRANREPAVIQKTFAQLVDFTSVHFQSEELMMRLYSYPELDEHAAAHATLVEQVRSIEQRREERGAAEALDVVGELRGWVMNHIQSMDQVFAAWLAQSGIQTH